MKIAVEQREVYGSQMESVEFTVKPSAHMMMILSGLYDDPREACVREYLTNMNDAYVAMIKAGLTPVRHAELHAPTTMAPYIEFKDFGIGMSPDRVKSVYTTYGDSTKSGNNDETGGLGLGCKTAFCYNSGQTWTVETRWEGKRYTFGCYIAPSGMPTMDFMGESDTDEPNGMTVRIPVLRDDIGYFNDFIKKFAKYYTRPLKVYNLIIPTPEKPDLVVGNVTGIVSRNSYYVNDAIVVMGGVPYNVKLKEYQLDKNTAERMTVICKYFSLTISAPIGSLDVTPSRDGLQNTPRTRAGMSSLCKTFLADLDAQINTATVAAKNVYEKVEMMVKFCPWDTEGVVEVTDKTKVFRHTLSYSKTNWNNVVKDVEAYSLIKINTKDFSVIHVLPNESVANAIRAYVTHDTKALSRKNDGTLNRSGHDNHVTYAVVADTVDKASDILNGFPIDRIKRPSNYKVVGIRRPPVSNVFREGARGGLSRVPLSHLPTEFVYITKDEYDNIGGFYNRANRIKKVLESPSYEIYIVDDMTKIPVGYTGTHVTVALTKALNKFTPTLGVLNCYTESDTIKSLYSDIIKIYPNTPDAKFASEVMRLDKNIILQHINDVRDYAVLAKMNTKSIDAIRNSYFDMSSVSDKILDMYKKIPMYLAVRALDKWEIRGKFPTLFNACEKIVATYLKENA